MKLEVSVIVPYSRQDESRIPALVNLLNCIKAQDLKEINTGKKNWEFIFIEQDTGENYQNVKEYTKGIADKHIVVSYPGPFNKSWCMNVAARHANSDWLCFVDADMLFGKEYLYYSVIWKDNRPIKYFGGWNWILKLPGRDEPILRTVRSTSLTAGGVFWCRKDFFWEVGGMNENYFGYGGEDNDFWCRINASMGDEKSNNIPCCDYPMAHTYHHNSVPSPERFYFLDRTSQNPKRVIDKLKAVKLGQEHGPTVIDMSDLTLHRPGLESKKGIGLIG